MKSCFDSLVLNLVGASSKSRQTAVMSISIVGRGLMIAFNSLISFFVIYRRPSTALLKVGMASRMHLSHCS